METPETNQKPNPEKSEEQKKIERNLKIIKLSSATAHGDEQGLAYQKNNAWEVYDSSLQEFENSFKGVLPEGGFVEFINTHYSDKKGEIVGMELGGPGRKLFSGFPKGIFKETLGVSLNDLRNDQEKQEDELISHSILEADVFSRRSNSDFSQYFTNDPDNNIKWSTVEKWVKEHQKPDIIIERLLGGLDMIRRKDIFLAILNRWYKILNENGTIFFEAPRNREKGVPIEQYEEILKKLRESPTIEIRTDITSNPFRPHGMIRKLEGAPPSLEELLK